MYLRLQIGFFWTILLLSSSVGLNVFDDCDEDGVSCPAGSRCLWRGCDGRKCICETNLLPSLNKTSCVKETPLGEKCKMDSVCVGQPLSECRQNTICSCLEGYRPSVDGTYCVLVLNSDDVTVEYGQHCDNEKYWCFPDDLQCSNHKCQCEPGFRPATKEERYAEPYNTRYCRPTSFQLGVPVNISGPECQRPEASTTTKMASFQTTSDFILFSPSSTASTSISSTSLLSTSSPSAFPSTEPSTSTTTTQTTAPPTTKPTTTFSTTTKSSTVTSTIPSSSASTTFQTSTSTKPTTTKKTLPYSTSQSSTSTSSTPPPSTTTTSTTTTTSRPSSSTTSSSTVSSTHTIRTEAFPSSTTSVTFLETSHTTLHSEEITSKSMEHTTRNSSTKLYNKPEVTTESSSTTISSSKADILSSTSTKSSAIKTPIQTPKSVNTVSVSTETTLSTSSSGSSVISSSTETSAGATSDPPIVGVGDKCLKKKCPVNSECVTDACNEERCRCKLGYADSPDGKSCWKLSALGEECGSERICQGLKTQCGDKGVCECENGYERSDSGRWCRLKTSWFIDFPVVGEECSGGFFSQCYMQFEQQCVNGKCQCLEGFREIVDRQDMDAVYPDIIQCRNDSFSRGARDSMLCLHQSRESRDYDIYNRAKSKIRKIQGAIIGGCVGFVAMLGIVIGVVALVRWKRRGRREPIRDSSSTASTDATSRYSFKIPRPFTHFVGAKEYDSTQISYPNEVFQKDDDTIINQTTPDVVNVGTLGRQNQNKQHSS